MGRVLVAEEFACPGDSGRHSSLTCAGSGGPLGLTLSGGALAALLTDNAMSAAVPSLLSAQTANGILTGAAPASITTLAEGVLHAMFMTKLKKTVVALLTLTALGGVGVGAYYLRAQQPPLQPMDPIKGSDKTAPDRAKEDRAAERMQRLLKERRDAAELERQVRHEKFKAGAEDATLDRTIGSSKRLLKAELELAKDKAERLAAHEKHLTLMQELAKISDRKDKVARISRAEYAQAEYERLDAEIALEREKAK